MSVISERILRHGGTYFCGDEILNEVDKFDATFFAGMADAGYTAIWLRGLLRKLVMFEEAPHWQERNDERCAALNRIVAAGQRFGIGIYLYMNEPVGFAADDPIFERHPELQGPPSLLAHDLPEEAGEPALAFCTQSAFAETYLVQGYRQLFMRCPGLRGVILITASETLTHCYSNVDLQNLLGESFKYRKITCPRCRETTAVAVVVDVINKIQAGVRMASTDAKVIAWNWSWGMYEDAPQSSILAGLPVDVPVMCDMQRGGTKTIGGQTVVVDEYSFSYLGPSALYKGVADAARRTGRELWAKVLVNTTHEFLAVPYVPLPYRVARKAIRLREMDTAGVMCCWNYGCGPTWMAKLASRAFTDETLGEENLADAVYDLAATVYGTAGADSAVAAWQEFDAAYEHYPFDISLVYYGPHHYGTGFEWVFTDEELPMPWYWLRGAPRFGTRFDDWCVQFTPDRVAELWQQVCDRWAQGLMHLAQWFGVDSPYDRISDFDRHVSKPGFEDFQIARTVHCHLSSSIAFIRFRQATLRYFAGETAAGNVMQALLVSERPRVRAMRQILEHYPAIAFEGERQERLYTPENLDEKLRRFDRFSLTPGERL